jgi:hypothetical protein
MLADTSKNSIQLHFANGVKNAPDYQWWLTVRESGENYVNPRHRGAAYFGE